MVQENPRITAVWRLPSLIGTLSSTAQAALPAQLQLWYLQQQLIESLRLNKSYQSYITLNQTSLQEIEWWISNLHLTNGKSIVLPSAKIVIQPDASKKGWGAHCLGQSVGGQWTSQESSQHINLLELKAVHLALLTFSKVRNMTAVHLQMDNMTALSYLVRMGGTNSKELTSIAKDIWDFLLKKQMKITAEYLPEVLHTQTDIAS